MFGKALDPSIYYRIYHRPQTQNTHRNHIITLIELPNYKTKTSQVFTNLQLRMVQGLGFLSKKSWHTKNLNNQEKVWIAEQQQEQERVRTTELAKQIQIEREQNEINDITGGITSTNSKKKIYDRGIDWMYTGQTKDSEIAKEDAKKIAEEYLLGKPIAFHGAAGSLPVTTTTTTIAGSIEGSRTIDASMTNEAVAPETAVSEYAHNDDIPSFKQNHKYEDPMYAVSLQTVRKEKMIEQQKELYHKVGIATMKTGHDDGAYSDNDDMRKKSKVRVHKTSKKKKSRKYDSDHSEDESERNSKHHKRSQRHSRDHHRERSRPKQSSKGKRKRHDDSSDSRDSASTYSDDRHRKHNRGKYNDGPTESHHQTRHRNRAYDQHDHDTRASASPPSEAGKNSSARYGLVTKHATSSDRHYNRHDTGTNDLGPDMELLQRKREEKYGGNRDHTRSRSYTNNHDHRGTVEHSRHQRNQNPEERAKALRAMEENAKSYDATRRQAKTNDSTSGSHDHSSSAGHAGIGATFLHEISQQVHGVYDKK